MHRQDLEGSEDTDWSADDAGVMLDCNPRHAAPASAVSSSNSITHTAAVNIPVVPGTKQLLASRWIVVR
jgi:hypothetical protein